MRRERDIFQDLAGVPAPKNNSFGRRGSKKWRKEEEARRSTNWTMEALAGLDQGKFEDRIVKMGSLGSDMEWDAARPQARELGERILGLQRGRMEPEGLLSPEHALCRLEAQSLENVLKKKSGTGTRVSDK